MPLETPRKRALLVVLPVASLLAALLFTGLAATATAQSPVRLTLTAAPGPVDLETGRRVSGWLYNGQLPGPTIRVREGTDLEVRFINRTTEPSSVHWHGLPVPLGMDGVPGVSRPAVEPGQEFTYRFKAQPSGTFFFHSHANLQMDRGLYGVLIIEPKPGVDPKVQRDYTIVLDDWLAGAPVPGRDPVYSDYLINGKTSKGQTPFTVKKGETARLRFVNASAGTNYVVAVDGHQMLVTHADGRPVVPVRADAIPIGAGERYDVIVSATKPGKWSIAAAALNNRSATVVRGVLAYEGSTAPDPAPSFVPGALRTGTLLTYAQLKSAVPVPPIKSVPDRTHDLTLGWSHMQYVWSIGGQVWPNAQPLALKAGENVRMILRNRTMHEHPMHLHGHFFRLLNTAGGTTAAPMKDTVLVPRGMMSGRVDVEFLADNPGNWPFHCHHLYHAEAGMFRLFEYAGGDLDGDGLGDGRDLDPRDAYPVLTTAGSAGYRVGTTMSLTAQWPAGESVFFHVGVPLNPAIDLGSLGRLWLTPFAPIATAVAGNADVAVAKVPIPAVAALKGQRFGFQAAATHKLLTPGIRLSTLAVVTFQ